MATSGVRMTGLAYVPPIDPMLEREKVPPDRSFTQNKEKHFIEDALFDK